METKDFLNKEFMVRVSVSEALKVIGEKIAPNSLVQEMVDRIDISARCRREFIVKLFKFDKVEDGKLENEYIHASITELLPLLVQYPEFKEVKMVAMNSQRHGGGGDYFTLTSTKAEKTGEWYLGTDCFDCCFAKRSKEGFYFLGVKCL